MSLLEVRTQFIKLSGRFDLVVDATDFADNGADWYINRGQRLLDNMQDHQDTTQWYKTDISSGDACVLAKGLRVVEEGEDGGVWAADSDSNAVNEVARYKLERVNVEWAREQYAMSDSGLDTGKPLYYYQGNIRVSGQDIIQNGAFDDDDTGWTLTGDWSVANGKATFGAGAQGSLLQAQADQLGYKLVSGNYYLVSYEVVDCSAGNVRVTIKSGTYGATRTACGIYTDVLQSDGGSIAFVGSNDFEGSVDNISAKQVGIYDNDRLLGNHFYEYEAVHILPPSDGSYTISILGKFYSPKLIRDNDKTFWTEEYPNILVHAALYELEKSYRNSTGANDWLNSVVVGLKGIDDEMVEQEISGITSMEPKAR